MNRARTLQTIWHDPVWEPTMLPVDGEGNMKPGYECVHPLENGNGLCGGNVFELEQAVGRHCCMVATGNGVGW